MSVLGKRIERERRLADLTQAELAGKLGLTHATLAQIESGTRQPSNSVMQKLHELGFGELTDYDTEMAVLQRQAQGASLNVLRAINELLRLMAKQNGHLETKRR